MTIKPLTKIIIVDGLHLQSFRDGQTLDYLLKKIKEMGFEKVTEIEKPSILIFRNPAYKSSTELTHVIINLSNLIAEINYYSNEF